MKKTRSACLQQRCCSRARWRPRSRRSRRPAARRRGAGGQRPQREPRSARRWAAAIAATIRTTAPTRRIRCPTATTVWIEEMTWMDVRDALEGGQDDGDHPDRRHRAERSVARAPASTTTCYRANCDAIARKLGNALCAPIIKFVPEGDIEPPTSHMTQPRHDQHARRDLPRRARPTSRTA